MPTGVKRAVVPSQWKMNCGNGPSGKGSHHTAECQLTSSSQGPCLHGSYGQRCLGPTLRHSRRRVGSLDSLSAQPIQIYPPSFDIEMPIECDDEYWDHPDPEQRWRQPPGKPSLVTAFNLYLKLNQVLAFSLRTIVSPFLASPECLLTMIPVLHQ